MPVPGYGIHSKLSHVHSLARRLSSQLARTWEVLSEQDRSIAVFWEGADGYLKRLLPQGRNAMQSPAAWIRAFMSGLARLSAMKVPVDADVAARGVASLIASLPEDAAAPALMGEIVDVLAENTQSLAAPADAMLTALEAVLPLPRSRDELLGAIRLLRRLAPNWSPALTSRLFTPKAVSSLLDAFPIETLDEFGVENALVGQLNGLRESKIALDRLIGHPDWGRSPEMENRNPDFGTQRTTCGSVQALV